jgi:hypothetical protein
VDRAAELPQVRRGPPIVLYDDQRRIEEGRLTTYVDRAIRIDNPRCSPRSARCRPTGCPTRAT